MDQLIYKDEVYTIVGICMEIHRQLGHGFLEVVYKDAIVYEFKNEIILFDREKPFNIRYKNTVLKHQFIADFVVMDKIIVEVKANKEGISNETMAQTINYLKASGCQLGLIINFGASSLEYKRVILKSK